MESAKPLAKQVALVTGGTQGIGLAIAHRLGRMGARIAICARSAPKLKETQRALRAETIEALALPADVTRTDQVAGLIEQVRTQLGPIDILVNNAGIGAFGPFHELSEADWDRVLNTNLRAVFLISKAVAAGMIERRSGYIINISSLAGKNTFAGAAAYCASKWGLQGLSGCMAEDLRGYGIRVSVICPGTVHTEFSPHADKDPGKMLQPDDIAHIVAMLVTQAPQSFASEIHLRPTHKP
ncbi:MAG: SDR family oxidoreductase [Candidatus Acidiferrales bacterium]